MLDPYTALAAASRPLPRTAGPPRRALLIGGGGNLGAAVLERLLAEHRFERVGVLADAALNPAIKRLQPLALADVAGFGADTALVVFDRERHANGRDAAFHRPDPAALLTLAAQCQAAGVQTLVVVVPHSAALMPAALSAGLASMDEGAVAALGLAQLVFMRTARPGIAADGQALNAPQRLAAWMLSQLHWLVPQREQPVGSATVARTAVAVALLLRAAPGESHTRVLAPAWLWHAAQASDAAALEALLQCWQSGQPPPLGLTRQRW